MASIRLHSLLLCAALAASCAGHAPDARTSGPSTDEARAFQGQVDEAAGDTRLPGLVVALREADGRVVVAATGQADLARGTPMRPESSFYIGTISQSMLAAVIFKLEEEGELSLDDPISRWVEFPRAEKITVVMLLDHSSGVADWTGGDLAAAVNPRLPALLRTPQGSESLWAVATATEPAFEPGTRQEASYTNFLLLSRIIEKAGGKPAPDVLKERIFEPAGMTHTRYLRRDEQLDSLASGYRAEEGWGDPLPGGLTEAGWADANLREVAELGIVSTAEDVLRYHLALRTGTLISAESFERMRTVRPGKINGLGYLVLNAPRGQWEGNNGHAVGHLCCTYYHVGKGFYVAMMANLGDTGLPLAGLYDLRYGGS